MTRFNLQHGSAYYVVLYTDTVQRQQIPEPLQVAMQARGPEFTAYIQGVHYAWVYRLSGLSQGHADVDEIVSPPP